MLLLLPKANENRVKKGHNKYISAYKSMIMCFRGRVITNVIIINLLRITIQNIQTSMKLIDPGKEKYKVW